MIFNGIYYVDLYYLKILSVYTKKRGRFELMISFFMKRNLQSIELLRETIKYIYLFLTCQHKK